MSLAELPQVLIDPTAGPLLSHVPDADLLSRLLRDIRVARCLQYCFEPHGDWMVDASPAPFRPPGSVSMHIVVEGQLWLDLDRQARRPIRAGDVLVFPRGQHHYFGAGPGGRLLSPGDDVPPPPWERIPTLRYTGGGPRARILCGFIQARVLDFRPLLEGLPAVMLARTGEEDGGWLPATVQALVREIDTPSPGGMGMVARLSELVFIELLRRQLLADRASSGWLAALRDPVLRRALRALHGAPDAGWSQQQLAAVAGASKTLLCQRFQRVLKMSPMRYLRDWKLYRASSELIETQEPIARIAERAGYGTEAAFSRAFARCHGLPPAAWRRSQAA